MTFKTALPVLGLGALLLCGCATPPPDAVYREHHRPQLSFSPERNWMNDPNGLVYHDGEYHLFYQFNPSGNAWGDMSWGHAVSPDLLNWSELPPALPVEKDAKGAITQMFFSGSAVVDHANASGLGQPGKPAMVALYTAMFPQARTLAGKTIQAGTQAQSLAYSLDRGRSWTQYPGNPVIELPPAPYAAEYRDFRDPKLFWHAPQKKWVMVAVLPNLHKALFYSSRDLLKWELMSEFGPAGSVSGIWECPDLFELPVDGDPARRKWVLVMSQNPGHPAGGSGTQYFVGDFDGTRFTWDRAASDGQVQWLDYGADFYAGVTYNGVPDGRRLLVGWMNNWLYGQQVPTTPWRGAQSVPRELSLATVDGKIRLVQQPLAELKRQRAQRVAELASAQVAPGVLPVQSSSAAGDALEIELRLQPGSARYSGIRVRAHGGQYTEVGYDREKGTVYLDRSRAGQAGFHADFAARHHAPVALRSGQLPLRILVDGGSVTVFAGQGEAVLTDQVFPGRTSKDMALFSEGGTAGVTGLSAWSMKPVQLKPANATEGAGR
ncbi:glycoside hydrolase family 32 protein [Pseudoduganella sp. SL102]|uniref:glycoside hydrolase family 32 protein n=1 Tax=Pseudoduganella sp. SL102 TaxID=2995154 RepID=UPI00248BA41A|nr:glycoside hydrolase family 32 protein [Pseudoduganella sp. SL102]WBS01149.1 glycoside hydrolase family 32 protein [Pseudoduganella sp. SL102]